MTKKPKATQPALGNGSLLVDASPLVSGAAPRAQVERFQPQPVQQPRLISMPPAAPPPKVRQPKTAPPEQMPLFGQPQEIGISKDRLNFLMQFTPAQIAKLYHQGKVTRREYKELTQI